MSIKILALETSCDETAAAVVENGREILSNVVVSQMDLHAAFGGVVPELASRKHIEAVCPVVARALADADIEKGEIDAVAVTRGPGLVGALLVGVSAAKALAFALGKPLLAVHHMHGHVAANYLAYPELSPPFAGLIISGGHSHVAYIDENGAFEILGKTRDDAAGEAFDKIARALGLGYPGGPKLEKLARAGDPDSVRFPRAYLKDGGLDFSFSGLKTAVINFLHQKEQKGEAFKKADVAAAFQKSAAESLARNAVLAAKAKGCEKLVLAGGVAANGAVRDAVRKAAEAEGLSVFCPPVSLCTDNAAMIGAAAYPKFLRGEFAESDLNAVANLKL
jgi:N6-L-threonylcarbamoyladenine synthase